MEVLQSLARVLLIIFVGLPLHLLFGLYDGLDNWVHEFHLAFRDRK